MSEINRDKDKALRILEALSGADAELVERCESGAVSGRKESVGKGSFAAAAFRKYLAACAVFVVVCVGTFALYVTTGRNGSASPEPARDSAGLVEYALTDSAESGAERNAAAAGSMQDAGQEQQASEPAPQALAEDEAENALEGSETELLTEANTNRTEDATAVPELSGQKSSRSEISLADAEKTENVGAHIPGIVPERFALESCTRSDEDAVWHELTFRWADTGETIDVFVTDYYLVTDGFYHTPDYADYGTITEETVKKQCAVEGGRTSFYMNIRFEDGVYSTVSVDADMTSEEIYKMLVSMGTVVVN